MNCDQLLEMLLNGENPGSGIPRKTGVPLLGAAAPRGNGCQLVRTFLRPRSSREWRERHHGTAASLPAGSGTNSR